jgi:hypothetical protein
LPGMDDQEISRPDESHAGRKSPPVNFIRSDFGLHVSVIAYCHLG